MTMLPKRHARKMFARITRMIIGARPAVIGTVTDGGAVKWAHKGRPRLVKNRD